MSKNSNKLFSIKGIFNVYTMAALGMLAALKIVITVLTTTHLGPTLRIINFNYLPNVLVGYLFGPIAGVAFGGITDIVVFMVRPQGPFFIGYTISEMVMCFIYGCFLFNSRPVSIWRVAAARLTIIITVFFGLNFIWESIMFGANAGKFFNTTRLINNIIQFPVHVFLSMNICKLSEKIEKLFVNKKIKRS